MHLSQREIQEAWNLENYHGKIGGRGKEQQLRKPSMANPVFNKMAIRFYEGIGGKARDKKRFFIFT